MIVITNVQKLLGSVILGLCCIVLNANPRKKKKKTLVKKECIDEVASIELMKEVERKLWLTHHDMLSKKLTEIIREKCTGCEFNEPNQLAHDLCLLASVE